MENVMEKEKKDTLRELTEAELKQVSGGASTQNR
jgi:bacteriocin-like protein